jgi:hypothetical protein
LILIQFPNGKVETYSANIIAENIYSQLDAEGNYYLLLGEIMDHHQNVSAIHTGDKFLVCNGRKVPYQTTISWEFLVKWHDRSTSWEPLKNLKDSNPVELAEYVIKSSEEVAFCWWVPYTLKRQDLSQLLSHVPERNAKNSTLRSPHQFKEH